MTYSICATNHGLGGRVDRQIHDTRDQCDLYAFAPWPGSLVNMHLKLCINHTMDRKLIPKGCILLCICISASFVLCSCIASVALARAANTWLALTIKTAMNHGLPLIQNSICPVGLREVVE